VAVGLLDPAHEPVTRRIRMLKNATYNLMETAAVLSKGLYRYDQFHKDAGDCQTCQQVWKMMKQHDEKQLEQLVQHLKQHLDRESTKAQAA
jgi:hypothetical protein